jgi:small subunit ribosomal protein S17
MQEEPNKTTTVENDPLNLSGNAPEAAADNEPKVGHRKTRTGLVVSNKMQKSIVVAVVRRVRHPLYKKYFNKTKKYMAHDEANECSVGDTVRIIETRPLSARKRWRLDAVVEKAK